MRFGGHVGIELMIVHQQRNFSCMLHPKTCRFSHRCTRLPGALVNDATAWRRQFCVRFCPPELLRQRKRMHIYFPAKSTARSARRELLSDMSIFTLNVKNISAVVYLLSSRVIEDRRSWIQQFTINRHRCGVSMCTLYAQVHAIVYSRSLYCQLKLR